MHIVLKFINFNVGSASQIIARNLYELYTRGFRLMERIDHSNLR